MKPASNPSGFNIKDQGGHYVDRDRPVDHLKILAVSNYVRKIQDWLTIVRVQYFVRGGSVGHRSRASSKHLSPHLPVDELDSSGGSNRGCAAPADARVGVGSTKKAD
ncbi:hypothetical protein TNCV_3433661 [Trichonephila clavipes]|nr:hypothetical protein TNCV_3433661 [Trichonephila clavipes]